MQIHQKMPLVPLSQKQSPYTGILYPILHGGIVHEMRIRSGTPPQEASNSGRLFELILLRIHKLILSKCLDIQVFLKAIGIDGHSRHSKARSFKVKPKSEFQTI